MIGVMREKDNIRMAQCKDFGPKHIFENGTNSKTVVLCEYDSTILCREPLESVCIFYSFGFCNKNSQENAIFDWTWITTIAI